MKFTIKLIICFLFCFSIADMGFSQGLKKNTADKHYNMLAYTEALEYYKDLGKSSDVSEDVLLKTARCYYYLQEYQSALESYDRLKTRSAKSLASADILNYIQCLKYTGNYAAVQAWLDTLNKELPGSSVYTLHRKSANYYEDLKKDSALYKVYNVKNLNTSYSEFSPYLDTRINTLVFASNRRNVSARNKVFAWDESYFIDSYSSVRKDSVSFAAPVAIKKFVTRYHDGPMVVSGNGKIMYVTRTNVVNRKVGKSSSQVVNLKLFIYERDSLGHWDEGKEFPYNSNEYSVGHATLSKNGMRLYFVSDMPGSYGQTDIWYSDKSGDQWQKPVNPGKSINTEGREMFPFLYNDEALFYSSDGRPGLGGLDICYSTLSGNNLAEARLLSYPLNTNSDDFGVYLNRDLRTGYLSSNREGGAGKDDIYYFSSKLPIFGVRLNGTVYDENSKGKLVNAQVYLLDPANNIIDSARSNSEGRFIFTIQNIKGNYKLGAKERSRYYDRVVPVNELRTGDNQRDIFLFPKYKLICTVYEAKTHAALDSVKVTMVNKYNNEHKSYNTDSKGSFSDIVLNKKAGDAVGYLVKFERPGYITAVHEYNIVLDTNTIINLNEKLTCDMVKLENGIDIGKTIKMSPIYFDLAKWNIRPDAAAELDKIVEVMKENPRIAIELGSHTDCRSSASYNMKLSDKRAKSSAAYIISKGIDKARVKGVGYGESKLINRCECEGEKMVTCTEEEHQQNRRTEFLIIRF